MSMIPTPSIRRLRKLADPKITILPTAPERKVQQNYNRAAATERQKLREVSSLPSDRYVDPQLRQARVRAKAMEEIGTSPLLFVVLAMLDVLPRDQRQAMIEKLAPSAVAGGAARGAIEVIRSTMLTFGEQWYLIRAQDELRGGDVT